MTNLDKIAEIFPEVITETEDDDGKLIRAIDFEHLKQILSDELLDGREAYVFNFVGKKKAEFEAHKPIKKTLRPIISASRDFESTKNLYIEGDNLDALKILQESYLGKVKMIYIDPPYNTGNDFIYLDDYKQDADAFDDDAQVLDDDGNRLLNRESRGRFHSDWCAMIYSRLLLAKNFLSPDGVIFISIDDHEQANLKKMCDEVFGEKNFVADILWNSTKSVTNTAIISVSHTHNLVYFKNMDYFIKNRTKFRLPDDGEGFSNPDNDPRGAWKADPFQVGGWRPNQQYEIVNPNTGKIYKPNLGCSWKNDYEHFQKLLADNRIVFGKTGDGAPLRKRFIHEAAERGKVAKTWWDDVETTTNGTQSLKKMFDGKIIFDNPKPVSLIKKFLQLATEENSIVMDFFSGSATTAHAVMELNAQDGGNRRFIMIQIDEPTPENSEARRAGFKTICDIGKERIRRAGDKIKAENPAVDTGFRVFKVDSSNFKPIPKVWTPQTIDLFAENIKDDRDEWDLLFGTLLEIGNPIDLAVEVEEIDGVKVLNCAGGEILASFDKNIPAEVFRALARRKPQKIFFRDASFASSADKINALEFFRNFAPDTTVKVL